MHTMICLMDFGGKCIIKEYTPDKYIDDYNKNKNPFFHSRMDALTLVIDKRIKRMENEENNGLIEIYHVVSDQN